VNLVRAIAPDTGTVVCEGRVIHAGKRTATAEAKLTQEATGKLLAHAKTTCLVLS
jgi:acyl-coenzyme A thioesterase PaaI-like protein